ncbi:short-chain dehydrogenase/reductase family 16C member 6 isoform X1 [Ceratitis capitata]|uniref:Short-chain dehydrogenase/reductase 3 n=1 Tax=Ceratitis capitata TaxID=7213 RepID=A0A811UAH9_CERCA|nr:short-chain dehydrogenase/reductase family 16C member 6 isoform X1 [Ceratitis capitata]CAD6994375.1 unnamed protein product [Ceratitis capitata]
MSTQTFKIIRAWLLIGFIWASMPIVLTISIVKYIYDTFIVKKEIKNITGEVAVITGSAGGLGKCIAKELAAKGCNVAICDINYELAVSTAQEIADKYGVKAKAYKVDVTKYQEIVELNEKLTKDIGAATILVNNAGLLLHSDQLNPSLEEIDLMVKVNYTSHFWTNRVFMENMKKVRKGHIMAISSIAGLVTLPQSEPYCSTKTAVRTLMRVLRADLKLQEINYIGLTTVFPSFLQTHGLVKQLATESGYADLYPLMAGEEVAKRAVNGMLRDEVEIAIPGFFALSYRLLTLLPAKAQDWVTYAPISRMNGVKKAFESIKRK